MELPSSRRLVRPILPTSLRMSVLSRASRSPMRYWAIVGTSGGKACNCYWLLDDSAEWSTAKKITLPDGGQHNGYQLYAQVAKEQGLTAGGFWTSLKDWPHVHVRPASGSPSRADPYLHE